MGARVSADPKMGPGQGAALEHRPEELLRAQVVGGVLIHVDLLQDDPPFGLHRLLGKGGVIDHVEEDIQGLGQMAVQHPAVEAGTLLGGKGVHLAADGVGFPGNVLGGTALGPFEEHVLNKMRRAGLRRGLLREPPPTQMPRAAERTVSMGSVTMRTPLGRVSI